MSRRCCSSPSFWVLIGLLVTGWAPAAKCAAVGVQFLRAKTLLRSADSRYTSGSGLGVGDADAAVFSSSATGPGGLKIGTTPGGANVVSDSDVVSTWSSASDMASEVSMSFSSTTFYLTTGEPLVLVRTSVSPALSPHARVHIEGALADQLASRGEVTLKPQETVALAVRYECLSQGSFDLAMTLEIEGLSNVVVPWKKTCGGVQNNALMVTGGLTNERVVVQGQPRWDESKVVGTGYSRTRFSIFVDPLSSESSQDISTPRATTVGACDAEVSTAIVPNTAIGPDNAVEASVRYACTRQGSCVVTMEVPFFPEMAPYRPARWTWTKMCGGSAQGIDIEADSGAAVGGQRFVVAKDGAANATAGEELRVQPSVATQKVWLVNDEQRSYEPQVRVRFLRVACLDSLRCTARLKGDVPKTISAVAAVGLDIEYSCFTSGGSLVQLLLETEGHDEISVMWSKDCSVWLDSVFGIIATTFCFCMVSSCACIGCMNTCCSKSMDVEEEAAHEDHDDEEEESGEEDSDGEDLGKS